MEIYTCITSSNIYMGFTVWKKKSCAKLIKKCLLKSGQQERLSSKYRELKNCYCILAMKLNKVKTAKCGNFTLLFWRGRHGIILKCVPHVQHAYFLPLDQLNS